MKLTAVVDGQYLGVGTYQVKVLSTRFGYA